MASPRRDDVAPVSIDVPIGRINGFAAPAFQSVAMAFAENFERREEVGAAVSISLNGQTVVDLWGGLADPATARPWTEDATVVVFSCTKAATAIAAHLLADRGALDLDAPVTALWPAFGACDKTGATTRMMLDHTVGLPAIRAPLKRDCLLDWDYMTTALAAEAPFWAPGTRSGYHALTYGFLVGEMVRRAAGQSLGRYFADAIAGPLGLEFWIGLPEQEEHRIAPIILHRPSRNDLETPFMRAAKHRGSIANLFIFNHGDWAASGVNTRLGRAAEIGAAGGVATARGLAGLFQATLSPELSRSLDFSAQTLAGFGEVSAASHADATLQAPVRFGPGFMLSMDNRRRPGGHDSVILGRRAYGHVGAGGSIGFADPEAGLAMGYVMNRQGPGLLLNARGQSLVDATYRALGRQTDAPGFWM